MSWSELRQTMSMVLNEEDLRTLCFDLGIEYDDLPAQGNENKIRELIAKMRRKGQIEYLLAHLNNIRTNINWDEIQLDIQVYSGSDHIFTQLTTDLDVKIEEEFLDEDEGILDRLERLEDAGERVTILIRKTGELAADLTEKMNIASMQFDNSKGDNRKKKTVAIRLAGELREYSLEIDSITKELAGIWQSFYSAFLPFFSLE